MVLLVTMFKVTSPATETASVCDFVWSFILFQRGHQPPGVSGHVKGCKDWGQAIVIKYFFFACLIRFLFNLSTIFLKESSARSLFSTSMII